MHPIPHRTTDKGSATVEWAALILLSAAVITVVTVSIPNPVADGVKDAICQLTGGDCGRSGQDRADGSEEPANKPIDYTPSFCEVSSNLNSKGFTVKILARGGSNTRFQRLELSDGSVMISAIPSETSLGLEGATPGAKLKGGDTANLRVGAEASGEWKNSENMIWKFDKDERHRADELERKIVEQGEISDNPVVAMWDSWTKDEDDYDLPKPDMVEQANGGRVSVSAQAAMGLKLPGTKKPGTGTEQKPAEERELDVGQGAEVGVEIEGGFRTRTRTEPEPLTDETTYAKGNINGSGEFMLGVGASGEARWESQIRQTRDKSGKLKGILLRADFDKAADFKGRLPFGVGPHKPNTKGTTSLAAGRESTMIDIPLNTPEERRLGEEFLRENSGVSGTASYFLNTAIGDADFVTEDPGENGDPWEKLVFDKGKVWTTSHNRKNTESEAGAEIKYGVPLGGSYTTAKQTRSTEDAQYLATPQNGRREFEPYDACIAR